MSGGEILGLLYSFLIVSFFRTQIFRVAHIFALSVGRKDARAGINLQRVGIYIVSFLSGMP